jgi:hypothetical protein
MSVVLWDSFIIHTAIDARGTVCQFLYCHTMTAPGERGATVSPTRQVRTPFGVYAGQVSLVAPSHLAVRCIWRVGVPVRTTSHVDSTAVLEYRCTLHSM